MNGPIVGYVGNLDIIRIDLELLKAVASGRPDWNLVFIGSMHKGREIKVLEKYGNVHFLGVRVYEQALRYIRHFDVAIIPHLDNELTRSMNPLKLYVYQSLRVPVVSTPIENIEDFGGLVHVGDTPEEFITKVEGCLQRAPEAEETQGTLELLRARSWPERVERVLALVEHEFSSREKEAPAMQPAGNPD